MNLKIERKLLGASNLEKHILDSIEDWQKFDSYKRLGLDSVEELSNYIKEEIQAFCRSNPRSDKQSILVSYMDCREITGGETIIIRSTKFPRPLMIIRSDEES